MLILSRKEGESIQIGGDVVIHVKRIKGSRCRLGIEAPTDTPIFRGELGNEVMTDEDENSGTKPLGGTDAGRDLKQPHKPIKAGQ